MTISFEVLFNEICKIFDKSPNLTKISSKFSDQKTDLDRIKTLIDAHLDEYIKLPTISKQQKCDEAANIYREEGNAHFCKRQYKNSVTSYTKCVTYSPINSQTLALGFGNRSAALFHLRQYKDCLRDIDLALQHAYPTSLAYKLLDRRGDCYIQLSDVSNGRLAYADALESLRASNLSSDETKTWTDRFEMKLKTRQKKPNKNGSIDEPPRILFDRNSGRVNLSNACCVRVTPERGRGIFSKREIHPGEILLVEKPFASVLLPQHYGTHCQFCFAPCASSVPCIACTTVVFCGVECRESALRSFHGYECYFLHYIDAMGLDKFAYLPLRAVIVARTVLEDNFTESHPSANSTENCGPIKSSPFLVKSDNNESQIESQSGSVVDIREVETPVCDSANTIIDRIEFAKVTMTSRYDDILGLVTNAQERQPCDLFRRAVLALLLVKILDTTSFFVDRSEDKLRVAGNLLSHVQSFPCNAHEVSQLQLNYSDVINSETIELGAAIYHHLSMFNHSCNPAVTRNFYGDVCVMRSTGVISADQEIFDNYGLHYAIQERIERRTKLHTQYLFKCGCEACVYDWPTYSRMCGSAPTWLCGKCHQPMRFWNGKELTLVCKSCNGLEDIGAKKQKLMKATVEFKRSFDILLSSGNALVVEPDVCRYLRVLFRLVEPPWEEFCKAQEALKQCYNIYGNRVIVDS